MPLSRFSHQTIVLAVFSLLMFSGGMTLSQSALAIDLPGGFSAGGFSKEQPTLEKGIHLYQEGQYAQSAKMLEALHQQDPANLKATYYLAMAFAQMGRYAQARKLYQEVAVLDPQGPIGHYAKEGLQYLPAQDGRLDPPPRFQGAAVLTQAPQAQPSANLNQVNPNPVNPNQAMAEANGMSLQEWQSLQMMLGNGNNANSMNGLGMNGTGMNNMMPFMMGQGQTLDPNIMSTLMMNQMMQNMDLGGGNNNNNN